MPESTIDDRRADLCLDRPVVERCWLWLTGIGDTRGDVGILRGRWGPSTRGIDIGAELGDRFIVSIRLVLAALSVAFGAALVTATAAAARRARGTTGRSRPSDRWALPCRPSGWPWS